MRKDSPGGPILPDLQVIQDSEAESAAMNMAIDEALLLTVTRPVLRFYGWRQPSLSFGYFGRCSDVESESSQREIVRRWTGGGIVLHGDDLTYSIILPRRYAMELPSPRAVYESIHSAIRDALSDHMDVALAGEDAPKVSDACFANAVAADVLIGGRKIAGAAQRRTRAGLLHQGSIQHPGLPQSFPNRFASTLCSDFETTSVTPSQVQRSQTLADQKYGTSEWLRRR